MIRKQQQIDGFAEIEKEKRPPEKMIWDGSSDEIEEWLNRVFNRKEDQKFVLDFGEVEG